MSRVSQHQQLLCPAVRAAADHNENVRGTERTGAVVCAALVNAIHVVKEQARCGACQDRAAEALAQGI